MGREHELRAGHVHFRWDNSLEPVLEVQPGDVVHYELQEVSGGQITPTSTAADLSRMDMERVYHSPALSLSPEPFLGMPWRSRSSTSVLDLGGGPPSFQVSVYSRMIFPSPTCASGT